MPPDYKTYDVGLGFAEMLHQRYGVELEVELDKNIAYIIGIEESPCM